MTSSQESILREIKDSLIKERNSSVDNFNKLIQKVQKQIDLVCEDRYLTDWKQWLEISFKNKSNEEAFDKWFRKRIKVEDITMIRGSFRGKREMTRVLTCGYLRDEMIYFYTESWDEFRDTERNPIFPESLYPDFIKDINECRAAFLKLKKEKDVMNVSITEKWTSLDEDIKRFIMVFCFTKQLSEIGTEKFEPYRKEDFSFMDY